MFKTFRSKHPSLRPTTITLAVLTILFPILLASSAVQGASLAIEPAPPVTARDFPFVSPDGVPQLGDHKIPNPKTPDGMPVGRAPACQILFTAGRGVTSQTVNHAIASMQNTLTHPQVLCLAGTFTGPIDVWGKYDNNLLTIEAEPGHRAQLVLGVVQGSAVDANEYDGVAGAVSIVDSTSVQVRGLTITGYHYHGFSQTPAGIYVEVRGKGFGGTPSACFTHGTHACGDIYLIDNHIQDIANTADEVATVKRWCNSGNIDAFGIEAESYGRGPSEALQNVVVEDNVIDHTRTGESETVAINGDVADFLVSGNKIYDTDNIGIDTEGWYNGTSQANHGYVAHNIVANVDTWNNTAYGVWDAKSDHCEALQPNAGGIYDDGGAYIWINRNVVANTDQGISLDTENANRWTDHILVSHNIVWDSPGTRRGDPSIGPNPAGIPGHSTVAGHAYDAFYVEAFGANSRIYDVYAYDNSFNNSSRYFGGRRVHHSDVVDFGGLWKNVVLWDNTISGGGAEDPWVYALGIDNRPTTDRGTTIDCTTYRDLSTVHHNFYLPNREFATLADWKHSNGYGWDAQSVVQRKPACQVAKP